MPGGGKSESMRVIVRVRPENSRECKTSADSNDVPLISVLDEQVLVFDPKVENAPTFFHGQKVKFRDMTKKKAKDFKCVFDSVLNQFSTQQELFEASSLDVVKSVVEGYNGSVFAYGATGAGKTHTMLGSVDQPGVIYQTMVELFRLMEEREETVFELGVSYMEIYNETIRDLFASATGRPLPLREDEQGSVTIAGLTYHSPKSVRELYDMLLTGNQNRTQHPTDANAQSSRSHAIFQVYLRQRPVNSGTTTRFSLSKLSLIDLAGSERAAATTNRANRMREGANINRSLLALGNCINALAENKKNMHIPWRNSQLTRILKDCLGTNCKTCMIAAVSPSRLTFEDTFNTLKYALRAKSIKSQLKKETVNITEHVGKYQNIIETLKKENERLNSQINTLREELKSAEEEASVLDASEQNDSSGEPKKRLSTVSGGAVSSRRGSRSITNIEARLSVKEILSKIKSTHTQRAQLRKSMLQIESEEKQHKMSLHFVDQMKKLVSVFSSEDDEQERRLISLQNEDEVIKEKMLLLTAKKSNLTQKMAKVEEEYSCVWGEVATWELSEEAEYLRKELLVLEQMIKINDLLHQNQHLKSLSEKQQDHISQQSHKLLPIAQFLRSILFEVEAADSLPSTQQWLHNFTNLQRSVMDNVEVTPLMASCFNTKAEVVANSANEINGDNFEQLLDFTIMKPISPKTPGITKNMGGKTPFTGEKIVWQQNNRPKPKVVPIPASKGDKTLTAPPPATLTKKRKSVTPRSSKVKQLIWSKSQNSRTVAAKQPKFLVSTLQGGGASSGKKKTTGVGPSSDSGSKSSGGFFSRAKNKQSVSSSATPATVKTTFAITDLNGRKRKQTIDGVSAVSKMLSTDTQQRSASGSSSRTSNSSSSLSVNSGPKQFKKSISSSIMPSRVSSLSKEAVANTSKTSRSWSRRRSKTPSPVSRRVSTNFKPIVRRETFVKPDLGKIFEEQRALSKAENEINRRCTVAASGSMMTTRSSNSSRMSRLTTKEAFRPIPPKKSISNLIGKGDEFSLSSMGNASGNSVISNPELTIFGTKTFNKLVDENTDPFSFASSVSHQSNSSLNFENEADNTVNEVRNSKFLDIEDTFQRLSKKKKQEDEESSFSFNTPDGKNDTFVRLRDDNIHDESVFDSGSKFVQNLEQSNESHDSFRRNTVNSYSSYNMEETVLNAISRYRRTTLMQNNQEQNK